MLKVYNKVNLDREKNLYATGCIITFYIHHLKCLIRFYIIYRFFPNVGKLVHPATLAISIKESPLQRAKDVNVESAECALWIVVLISDFSRVSTAQRPMILGENILSRATCLMRRQESYFCLNTDILPKNNLSI